MFSFDNIKKWLLRLELRYVHKKPFLERIPQLRFFNRKITADLTIISPIESGGIHFRIDFRTPYFRFPVAVEKTQVGRETNDGLLETASFRFFDWQSWTHIDGRVEWQGEQFSSIGGNRKDFVTGFSYSVKCIPAGTENLGIRLAEGVNGTVRVLIGREVVQLRFSPGYWMLEPNQSGYKIVAIADAELMVLIVSLSEIGSGSQRLRASAVQHLYQWVLFRLAGRTKEQILIRFLKYVRDWGPLGMEPLFQGLGEVLQRLGLDNQEHVFFEFYADNWGIRNNLHGRLLAVKVLEALATEKSRTALNAIFDYVKNRELEPEELDMICQVIRRMSERQQQ